tara:strand:- start:767 stop:1000 length:234 start_codon:yes stop_codon:yes gene_type:complete
MFMHTINRISQERVWSAWFMLWIPREWGLLGIVISHFFKTSYYLFFVQRLGFAALSVDTNLAPTFQRYGKQVSLPTA